MKKEISVILFITAVACLLPFSCKTKKDTVPAPQYDRGALLRNIGTSLIVPSYLDLKNKTADLYTAVDTFTNHPTAANLTALQDSWKTTTSSWKKCELYTFAYAGDYSLSSKIDAWVTNPTAIESEISGSNTLTEAYIASTSSTRKGFPAMEYLLFSNSGNTAVLNTFTSQTNYQRRIQYILALAADIKTKTSDCYNAWKADGGNYVATFAASTSTDANSSVALLLNALVQNADLIKDNKLGVPLGKKNNGTLHPELVEAPLSGMSLSHIRNNVTALENVFLGKANGIDGPGFDDYLTFVKAEYNGQPLSDVIKQQFVTCYATIDAIPSTLDVSLSSDNAKVEAAYQAIKTLTVLMKVDMASQLGILISISSSDGD